MGIFSLLFGKPKRSRAGALSGADRELIKREWLEIAQLLKLGDPSGRKEALIRADKALDLVLRRVSTGETMGERLKNAEKSFSDYAIYDQLWKAHKVRNALVHETGFEPPHYALENAVQQIRVGLKDIGALRR